MEAGRVCPQTSDDIMTCREVSFCMPTCQQTSPDVSDLLCGLPGTYRFLLFAMWSCVSPELIGPPTGMGQELVMLPLNWKQIKVECEMEVLINGHQGKAQSCVGTDGRKQEEKEADGGNGYPEAQLRVRLWDS